MSDGLRITITQASEAAPVRAEVWCPAFVDHEEHPDVEEALMWARRRLGDVDPFEDYEPGGAGR